MSRALPRVFLRRSRLDGGWCIPRTLQHMSIIPRKSRRDSSSHRDRRFPSASATFVRPAWSFVCLLLFVSFAHDVAPTSISSVRVVLLFHPCASPFSSRATTRLAVVAMSFVSCAMHQRVLFVRPTSIPSGFTRTNPGSMRRTRPFEPEPIRVQTRVRRRWRPTLSTSQDAVMTASGRGRDTCVARLERNEADAWRWEAHVQLCMHPQLRRGAKEMGSTRRRSRDARRGSASGPRRLQKKKKQWQGVPMDGSHGWCLHAAGRETSCHRHGRMRAGPPPCVVQGNREPSKREARIGESKACHDVARGKVVRRSFAT